jgi:hypothetical protein
MEAAAGPTRNEAYGPARVTKLGKQVGRLKRGTVASAVPRQACSALVRPPLLTPAHRSTRWAGLSKAPTWYCAYSCVCTRATRFRDAVTG